MLFGRSRDDILQRAGVDGTRSLFQLLDPEVRRRMTLGVLSALWLLPRSSY
jgi:hypothetical protein